VTDPALSVALASAGTAAVTIFAAGALRGWQSWLDVRRIQIGGRPAAGRADLAELRDRIRRLEAIANGAEL